jgi:hypothetical protein
MNETNKNNSRKQKTRFNYERLQEFCKENNIEIVGDYSKINVTRDTIIIARCLTIGCDEIVEKSFRNLKRRGQLLCFCKVCCEWGNEKLNKFVIKKSIQLIGEHTNVTRDKTITARCLTIGCDEIVEKSFRNFVENGGCYCKNHTTINMVGKCETTNLKVRNVKYSLQDPIVREKGTKTILNTLGVENCSQSEIIKKKKENTCMKNFNVTNPSQHPSVMSKKNKTSFRKKQYTMPSGIIREVMGYEPFALNDILKEGIIENDIITNTEDIPIIKYYYNNNNRTHFVDIYIISKNLLIEVKSKGWTYDKFEMQNKLKQSAGKNAGYNYEIWVYDRKGKRVECHK